MAGREIALQPNIGDAAVFSITGSGTIVGAAAENLTGMQKCAIEIRFLLGTGSGGVKVFVQTSLSQGNFWGDIVKWSFDDVSDIKWFPIGEGAASPVTPTSGGSGDSPEIADGIVCHILGSRLRAFIIVDGSYQNTLLSISAHATGL